MGVAGGDNFLLSGEGVGDGAADGAGCVVAGVVGVSSFTTAAKSSPAASSKAAMRGEVMLIRDDVGDEALIGVVTGGGALGNAAASISMIDLVVCG